jgi:calcium/calmodulin-dependent protein kinase I
LGHIWLSGQNASDHNLLPEIEAFRRRSRLRRAIEIVKLQNRINKLKEHEEDPENSEMGDASVGNSEEKKDGARLHALGLFALKDVKQKQETLQMEEELGKEAKRRSFTES